MSQKQVLLISKLAVVGVWLLVISAFFAFGDSDLALLLRRVFFALVVVHVLECAFFFRTLQHSGKPLAREVLLTLVFGVIHYGELKTELESQAQGPER